MPLEHLPFGAAHTPLQAPEKVIAKYNDITDRDRRVYAAMVDAMDSAIGRVLEAVGKQGVLDDTLVIYFNDNGGARAGADNGHLAKGKGSVYEGGIRVAAAMRWPAAIPAGKKSSQLTSVMDLFPTLIDAAGIERGQAKPFDGRSVWRAIKDGKKIGREGWSLPARRRSRCCAVNGSTSAAPGRTASALRDCLTS